MRLGKSLLSAFGALALFGVGIVAVRANDAEKQPSALRDHHRGVAFSSLTVSQWEIYSSGGIKTALFSKREEPGWKLLFTTGQKFRERDPLIVGRFNRFDAARLLIGHEWHRNGLAITAMAGASLSLLSPWERAWTRAEARLGAVGLVELWKTWGEGAPLPAGYSALTVMIDAAEASAFARLRHGFAIGWGNVTIGPEVSVSTGGRRRLGAVILRDSWLKSRLGLHIGGLQYGRLGLNLSAGYETRSGARGSAYAEVTTLWLY